ncbi:MAG: chromosome segregation protein SMC [Acidobacteria bacterium]|nr:chromosome segregation protein SMC [Acidobacteriota bacterium]
MLKLEKLELRGFKSFCDYTEFDLTQTVTGIVGPNGCGKSNLADSITWVLGEQSARSLRGAKMEDVIFQGSRARPPIGLAEVILTLVADRELSTSNGKGARENSDAEAEGETGSSGSNGFSLTVAPGERITVGRRLYRSGESEYLLNGRRVRLLDIYDLFAGTGLGPGHYAIIGQGHVEEIITAKPFERRAVIEAAAGITRFRLRQRTIELRLQSAKQNLTRIDDLVQELERQVRSLKRQAAKARRYRRLKEELRGLLRILFTSMYYRLESELVAVNERIAHATQTHTELNSEVVDLEGEYRSAIDATRRCESSLNEVRDQLNSIDLQLERTRGQRRSCREQIANLESKRVELQREEELLGQRLAQGELEIQRCGKELESLASTVQTSQAVLGEHELVYKTEVDRVKATERALEGLRQQLLEETNNNANLRNATHQVEVDLERVETKLKGLEAERQRALSKRAELEAQYDELTESVARDRERMEELEQQLARVEHELKQARLRQTSRTQELAAVERERVTAEERLALLVGLDRQHAYCSPAVQRLFEQEAPEHRIRLLGTLADFVHVKREHERVVENVLADRLQTILVPTIEDAIHSIAYLEQTNSGQGTFLVVGLQGGAPAPEMERAIPQRDSGLSLDSGHRVVSFIEVLNLRPGLAEPFRRAFLEIAEAQLVKDLETAIELSFNDVTRFFVTLEGYRVRAGSLLAGGGQEEAVNSLLAIKREIHELRARVAELNQSTTEAKSQLAAAHTQVEELEQALYRLRIQQQSEEKAMLECALQLTAVENDQARADQHLRVIDFEFSQAEKDLQELMTRRNRLVSVRQQAEEELARIKSDSEKAQSDLLSIRDEADRLSEELASLRAQVATTVERQRGLQADHDRVVKEKNQIENQLQGNAYEVERVEKEATRLEASLIAIDQALTQLVAERAEAEARVQQASRDLEQMYLQADEINATLDERRTQERHVREQLAHLEVERAQLISDAKHLSETCLSELAQPLEEVIALVTEENNPVETQVDLSDTQSVKDRVQKLRIGIEDLGPVNMMALEELEAQEERLEFLQDQRRDVLESIASTEKALEEVKRRSRRRFVEAFEAINANFADVFQELFGGGQGRMVLLDAGNPLESGIDIIAQPPGKRLQNIMLLSGGEKSMTAIALLLAIFRYRPSPFCVLDEVDAQLDEVNIRRFAKKIEEMSEQTQFIIITHSKTTMQAASALHGVTMEEPGVSKSVSVKLK